MDSRYLPALAVSGWLLVTLGIAGAVGLERWWVWPLSLGIGALATAGAYSWAAWVQVRKAAREGRAVPGEVRT
jgi:hypothetical protein